MARKYRPKAGDLAQLRTVLWRTILEVEGLLDVRPASPDMVLKSAHALAQLSNAYTSLVRGTDLQDRIEALEANR
jgi:hypothetical protein